MRKVAIIIRHDDDAWERNGHYETVIGFLVPWENVDLDTRAKSYIQSLQELYQHRTYKNILGIVYPRFSYKIISQLDSHMITFVDVTTNSPTDSGKVV